MPTSDPWRHAFVQANGIRFHYVEAGEGPLVVLLHGFPEFWYSWRRQIPALAERYRVVAPDLRGYNDTERPPVGYDVATLVADVVGLVGALGETRCRLAGHDWGGAIAWEVAARRPDVVERLSVLNGPHPTAMAEALRGTSQLLRSWYIFFFQLPVVPEWRLRADDYAFVERAIRGQMVHPERLSDEDMARYREAAAKPGALEAMLEYYRQAFRSRLKHGFRAPETIVDVPTQVIWGERDTALGRALNDDLGRWVKDLRVDYVPTASHWVQQDEPEIVTRLMLDFFGAGETGGA